MVFISNEKTTCFGLQRSSSGFHKFLVKRVLYNTSPRGLGILYKTLLARNVSKPENDRYRPKHVVIPLLINTTIQPYIFIVVFLTGFTSPYKTDRHPCSRQDSVQQSSSRKPMLQTARPLESSKKLGKSHKILFNMLKIRTLTSLRQTDRNLPQR